MWTLLTSTSSCQKLCSGEPKRTQTTSCMCCLMPRWVNHTQPLKLDWHLICRGGKTKPQSAILSCCNLSLCATGGAGVHGHMRPAAQESREDHGHPDGERRPQHWRQRGATLSSRWTHLAVAASPFPSFPVTSCVSCSTRSLLHGQVSIWSLPSTAACTPASSLSPCGRLTLRTWRQPFRPSAWLSMWVNTMFSPSVEWCQ